MKFALKSNSIRNRTEKQDWHKINCNPLDYIQLEPEKYIQSMSEKKRAILDLLLSLTAQKYRHIYPTQTWIAKQVGCSRMWASVLLLELETEGVIVSNYRHLTSCVYKVSRYFHNPFTQSRLGHLLKPLRNMALGLLVAASYAIPVTHFTQLGLKNNNVLHGGCALGDFYKKSRGMDMNLFGANRMGVSIVLRDEKIPFSDKINLSAFPDHVLEFALFKAAAVTNMGNLVDYLFKVCFDRANSLGITPNWGWVEKLKELHRQEKIVEVLPRYEFEKDDQYDYQNGSKQIVLKQQVSNKKPGGFPQKERPLEHRPVSRNPDGPSPMVYTEKTSRILSLEEFNAQIERYSQDKFMGDIYIKGLKKTQRESFEKLTPEQKQQYLEFGTL